MPNGPFLLVSFLLLIIPYCLTSSVPGLLGPQHLPDGHFDHSKYHFLPQLDSRQLDDSHIVGPTPESFDPITTAEPIGTEIDDSEDNDTDGSDSDNEQDDSGNSDDNDNTDGDEEEHQDAPTTNPPTTTTMTTTTTTTPTTITTTTTTTMATTTEPTATSTTTQPPSDTTPSQPDTPVTPTQPSTATTPALTTTTTVPTTTTEAPQTSTIIPVCNFGSPILRNSDVEGEETNSAGPSSSRKPGIWYCRCETSFLIIEAGTQTKEEGWLISMAPSLEARRFTGPLTFRLFRSLFDGMWQQAQNCFVWHNFSEDEMRTMYLQFLCHAKFGVFGLGGSTWDLESWKDVPTEAYALSNVHFPTHKCNVF